MTDGKCTFGTRLPIDIHMLNEIIYREVKHFRNYTIYTPNFSSIPVTSKFYATHDQITQESKETLAKTEKYHHSVAQTRVKGPHSKYPAPASENQVYGWYNKPLLAMDRKDRRFYQPKRERPNQSGNRNHDIEPQEKEITIRYSLKKIGLMIPEFNNIILNATTKIITTLNIKRIII